MGCPVRIGGQAGVNNINTSLNGLEMGQRRHPRGKMTVQMNQWLDIFL